MCRVQALPFLLVAIGPVGLATCGGSGAGSDPGGPNQEELDAGQGPQSPSIKYDAPPENTLDPAVVASLNSFCHDAFSALADLKARCYGGPAPMFLRDYDVEYECKAVLNAVKNGRLLFDPGTTSTCLEDIGKTSCAAFDTHSALSDQVRVRPASCAKVLKGGVATGTKCEYLHYFANECADAQSYCGATVCVTYENCTPLPKVGEECFYLDGCAEGLYCSSIDNVCSPLAKEGQSCMGVDETPCAAGLVCVGTTCRPFNPTTIACTNASQCASNNCVAGACQAFRDVGERCGKDTGNCGAHLFCDQGTCHGPVANGELCGSGTVQTAGCSDGFCDFSTARTDKFCTPYVVVGKSCNWMYEDQFGYNSCEQGAFCYTGSYKCESSRFCPF